jgi:hypothetical protein
MLSGKLMECMRIPRTVYGEVPKPQVSSTSSADWLMANCAIATFIVDSPDGRSSSIKVVNLGSIDYPAPAILSIVSTSLVDIVTELVWTYIFPSM